jgi:allophanate hydrolase
MPWSAEGGSLDFATLRRAYAAGLTPSAVIDAVYARIAARGEGPEWVAPVPRAQAMAVAQALERDGDLSRLPLYGLAFGVKDNFDLAGLPTAHGCRAASRLADRNHPVVAKLVAAGAIPVGKNNMDQFGVGLNGTRTDFGIPACVFDPVYISGGSTSGGGVAVASGQVSFALGGDAAGSGRVPAALNNIVGLKPTPHLVPSGDESVAGMTATHSILGLTVADCVAATRAIIGFDPADPLSRPEAAELELAVASPPATFRFGIPSAATIAFHGDGEAARLFAGAVERLVKLGGTPVEVDFTPFYRAAKLLYEGPFIAQRLANLQSFLDKSFDRVHPATRTIVSWGRDYSGADVFRAQYEMAGYRQLARGLFRDLAFLLTPTTPTTFTIAELTASTQGNIDLNAVLGTYTNFVNLMHLSALAVPGGFRADGKPLGVTLVGPELGDSLIAGIGASYHAALGGEMGATGAALV